MAAQRQVTTMCPMNCLPTQCGMTVEVEENRLLSLNVPSLVIMELTVILFLTWKKYARAFGNVHTNHRISSSYMLLVSQQEGQLNAF